MVISFIQSLFWVFASFSHIFFPNHPINLKPAEGTTMIGKGLQPKVVINEKGVIQMVYGLDDDIYYTESTNKGKSFTKPALLASIPDGLMLGMGRGPQLASWEGTTVVTGVNEKGNIYSWKLNTSSQKWEGPSKINDADTVAKEGFVALAKGKGSNVYAVWNDLRSGNNQLYGSMSTDGGLSWNKNKLIYASPDTTICECCHVSMINNDQGKLYVMWRNQLNGYRDMYLVSFEEAMNNFSLPVKLGSGSWQLKGCPMDGGNLSSDEKGNITTVWRREKDIFLCEPGKQEVRLGTGKTPVVIQGKPGYYVLWNENNEILFYSTDKQSKTVLGKGRYPGIVSKNGLTIAFWETDTKDVMVKLVENM